ncbi:MAG TPA: N(4)-(beta-N-acetylglucosaminyl)-L-asparaginase [Actinoallomurus sp.]|jgi:N4-(beta-N-acetylglucosaminyl)-L-asparaginase
MLSRRGLLVGSAGLAAAPLLEAAPAFHRSAAKPVVIASGNGHVFRNGGKETCVETAFRMITEGKDVLDSLIAGVNLVELDPLDHSVGYGGLPNAEGVVQLDSAVMHGPKKWAGGVAALEGVRTPSLVARAVAATTDDHLLAGKGAQEFARNMGFAVEDDLNTANSRAKWLEWKRRIDPSHNVDPSKRDGLEAALQMAREGIIDPEHVGGTINCDGINAKGEVCGVTTTSGLAFKIPGRVGDSPILGAGLYVDGEVGAAGSTGRGEANLYNLCSYLIVEELRRGKHPKDAGMEALRRVVKNTRKKRLLDDSGKPNFGLKFYVLDVTGRYASVTLRGNARYAVCDENGARLEPCEPLL